MRKAKKSKRAAKRAMILGSRHDMRDFLIGSPDILKQAREAVRSVGLPVGRGQRATLPELAAAYAFIDGELTGEIDGTKKCMRQEEQVKMPLTPLEVFKLKQLLQPVAPRTWGWH